MTRITPRTCLWPLAGSLSITFALSIGLTFRSNHYCFAGTCGEWLFPLQARLHVVVWYCWLAISVTVLAIRAFHPQMRKFLRAPILERKVPILGKQLAVSGVMILIWILSLYGIIVGIWWIRLRDYFDGRGIEGGVLSGNRRLAAIALTGHMCDVTMGMAILPISRHSALGSFFKLSVATTLAFHMLTAYTLFTLVSIHVLLYASWVAVFEKLSTNLRMVFPVLNPTYLYNETWPGNHSSLGVWRASLIFTGLAAASIFLLILVTTMPVIRRRHFNLFYFTHLLGIAAIIIICLHASTMFYCTSPGLILWVVDWLMRLYELRESLDGRIKCYGKGWYCLTIPLPRRRLDGCACTSPLAHFYIYNSDSSIRELHPFTTTSHLASQNTVTHEAKDDIDIQFLFRKRGASIPVPVPSTTQLGFAPSFFGAVRKLRRKKRHSQWTDRLADMADDEGTAKDVPVSLRLEGPYFTTADPARYRTVVCVVAGTGVSGALAIAAAFREHHRQSCVMTPDETRYSKAVVGGQLEIASEDGNKCSVSSAGKIRLWTKCIVIWSVREDDYIKLPGLENATVPGLEVQIHLTGNGRKRLDVGDALDEIMQRDESPGSMWVYISGPNPFIQSGEVACEERKNLSVDWYGAKWDI